MDLKYILWMFAVTSSLAGVQFVYSIQFAVGTSFFADSFGLSLSTANIILSTSGPISGFFAQPIVGVLSDGCKSRWGRRRPFILGGTLLTAFGMALLAVSPKLGHALGDDTDPTGKHGWGITISITGLWIMNLFANVMQGPSRALVNDIVAPEYLQTANSFVSAVMALAAVIGGILAAQTTELNEAYFYLLLSGAGCIVLVCIPTLIAAKETPLVEDGSDRKTIASVFMSIIQGFKMMPRYLFYVAMLYFFSWCAYTPQMINQTSYVRDNLFGQSETPAKGLQIAYYVTSIFAIVQFFWSLIQSWFTTRFGVKNVYLLTQLITTGCYICLVFDKIQALPGLAITLLVLVALNFAAFNSIPFALVARYTSGESGGLLMGVLNSASVAAQVVAINAVASPIIKHKDNNAAWGISVAGTLFSVFALVWGFILVKERPDDDKEEERKALINSETVLLSSPLSNHSIDYKTPPI